MHVGHAQVVAQFIVVITAAHAVIAQHARFFGYRVVIGGEHAALGAGHVLGRIQAEGARAKGTGALAVEFGGVCLAGIFNHQQVMFFGNVHDGAHICAQPIQINGQDSFGLGGNDRFDLADVHIEGARIDIHKDRFSADVQHRVGRGDKGKG